MDTVEKAGRIVKYIDLIRDRPDVHREIMRVLPSSYWVCYGVVEGLCTLTAEGVEWIDDMGEIYVILQPHSKSNPSHFYRVATGREVGKCLFETGLPAVGVDFEEYQAALNFRNEKNGQS